MIITQSPSKRPYLGQFGSPRLVPMKASPFYSPKPKSIVDKNYGTYYNTSKSTKNQTSQAKQLVNKTNPSTSQFDHHEFKTINYENGSYYIGQVINNKRDGLGAQFVKGGLKIYEGEWKDDQYQGKGVQYNNKQVRGVSVELANDKYKINQEIYENYCGEFKSGFKEGQGILKLTKGDYYIGEFKKGSICGVGALLNKSKKLNLQGIWKDDILEQQI